MKGAARTSLFLFYLSKLFWCSKENETPVLLRVCGTALALALSAFAAGVVALPGLQLAVLGQEARVRARDP
jgi:hypothetical protein